MSALDTIAAKCREFDLDAVREKPITPSGVYLLLRAGVVVYVGQSTDVETRIAHHAGQRNSSNAMRRKRFDRAIWFPVDRFDLAKYEGALIRAFGPEYNATAPSHRDDAAVLAELGIEPTESAAVWQERIDRRNKKIAKSIRASRLMSIRGAKKRERAAKRAANKAARLAALVVA